MGWISLKLLVFFLYILFYNFANWPVNCQEEENLVFTDTIKTKYGLLRGTIHDVPSANRRVARYLGVPYATPPVDANRFSPTRTLSQWVQTYNATKFGPACPQKLPNLLNNTAVLKTMSLAKAEYLRSVIKSLHYQDEDCLYLNIYVPYSGKLSFILTLWRVYDYFH